MASAVLALTLALAAGPVPSWHTEAQNAERKLHAIEGGRVRRGETVTFTTSEVNAFLRSRIPVYAPGAVRDSRVWFAPPAGSATAMVDFVKLQRATGSEPNWMIAKLIEGERPVEVSAHLKSSGGWATVYLDRVAISGMSVSGSPLDMLISTFVKPLFPEAKVNEPFELGYGIERLEITPEGLRVRLRR